MRYLITEQQNNRLIGYILKYFEENLTPYGGWDSRDEYINELDYNSGELFIPLADIGEWDMDNTNHMWYSTCDNGNLPQPLPEGSCPVLVIPHRIFSALDGFFGEIWKDLFKIWFQEKTGLGLADVDYH